MVTFLGTLFKGTPTVVVVAIEMTESYWNCQRLVWFVFMLNEFLPIHLVVVLWSVLWWQHSWNLLRASFLLCLLLCHSNTMYMLVKIGHFVITTQLSGSPVSYLSQQLANCLVSIKRLFDKFIVSKLWPLRCIPRNLWRKFLVFYLDITKCVPFRLKTSCTAVCPESAIGLRQRDTMWLLHKVASILFALIV